MPPPPLPPPPPTPIPSIPSIPKSSSSSFQSHIPGSIRHAEKRRVGTCSFADRIAHISLQEYRRRIPLAVRQRQPRTVVSTIVAFFAPERIENHDKNDDSHDKKEEDDGYLQVMGLGVGTKFLQDDVLRLEYSSPNDIPNKGNNVYPGYGGRVRDCHAEVLARRSFCRQLALELFSHYTHTNTSTNTSIPPFPSDYQPILEPSSSSPSSSIPQYQCKSNVTLHMYTSSAPCGNATLKKFAKMTRERYDPTLSRSQWPQDSQLPHPDIPAHSIRLGQFAVLLKKNHLSSSLSSSSTLPPPPSIQPTPTPKRKRKQWPCQENDAWCPPGCTIVPPSSSSSSSSSSGTTPRTGSIHSCSDKICRWNYLGWQGSLLSSCLSAPSSSSSSSSSPPGGYPPPIVMTTITIGRKMSACICKRALCCRVGDYPRRRLPPPNPPNHPPHSCVAATKEENTKEEGGGMHHPVIMGTGVYMDETGVLSMSGEKVVGQDVRFQNPFCWVWWPSRHLEIPILDPSSLTESSNVIGRSIDHDPPSSSSTTTTASQRPSMAECINGITGYSTSYDSRKDENRPVLPQDVRTEKKEEEFLSDVSTASMMRLYQRILHSSNPQHPTPESPLFQLPTSLPALRLWKQRISNDYETRKQDFLSNHRVFGQWCRREYDVSSSS